MAKTRQFTAGLTLDKIWGRNVLQPKFGGGLMVTSPFNLLVENIISPKKLVGAKAPCGRPMVYRYDVLHWRLKSSDINDTVQEGKTPTFRTELASNARTLWVESSKKLDEANIF